MDDFLTLSHLSVGYKGRTLFDNLNLSVAESELVALIGRNGVGKSTLMRTISRFQPMIAGDIIINHKSLKQYSRNELSNLVSIVSTESVGGAHLSVQQLVAFGRFPYTNWIGRLTEQDKESVHEAMSQVGILHLARKNLHEISDGERQRAMIARTLAQDTKIILLDEPTAFLDMPNKYEMIHLLFQLTRQRKKTIIFSTHDLDIAMQKADKLWLMVGQELREGAPEDLVLNGSIESIFNGTNLFFDDKGIFRMQQASLVPVQLTGQGKAFLWTKKALERKGFFISNNADSQYKIVISESSPTDWTLYKDGIRNKFHSLYELSRNMDIWNK